MADHRHKRDTNARRKPRAAYVAGPLALLATASAVTIGVLSASTETPDLLAHEAPAADLSSPIVRSEPLSRSKPRLAKAPREQQVERRAVAVAAERATERAVENADERMWTTATLNLWSDQTEDATQFGVVDEGERVLVTGREGSGRVEIVVEGESRWVTAGYLSDEKPVEGIGGDCTNGTSVSPGVSPNIVKVHEAVCAAFPEITTYGTFRGDGEHSQGIAVDIMVSGARGWEVAEFVRENYAALGVSYLIYSQKIWSVERSGEGWRPMSDRGSATANHYDHVHVTTY